MNNRLLGGVKRGIFFSRKDAEKCKGAKNGKEMVGNYFLINLTLYLYSGKVIRS